jgi:ATP-dependent Lon protease
VVELDDLDRKATEAFPGHMVRKDLVRRFRGQFPVPTYVVEFMLGRYCASIDPAEIDEGLVMVQEQLTARTVRAGEEELFKARARDKGATRMIDIITARLDAKSDSYLATLPSLRLTDVRIGDKLVRDHDRMLTGGFYAEVELGYDPAIAQEKGGRPFEILTLR